MKKQQSNIETKAILICFFTVLFLNLSAQGSIGDQAFIKTKDKEKITGRILDISDDEIRIRTWSNLIIKIPVSKIKRVKYFDQDKHVFFKDGRYYDKQGWAYNFTHLIGNNWEFTSIFQKRINEKWNLGLAGGLSLAVFGGGNTNFHIIPYFYARRNFRGYKRQIFIQNFIGYNLKSFLLTDSNPIRLGFKESIGIGIKLPSRQRTKFLISLNFSIIETERRRELERNSFVQKVTNELEPTWDLGLAIEIN